MLFLQRQGLNSFLNFKICVIDKHIGQLRTRNLVVALGHEDSELLISSYDIQDGRSDSRHEILQTKIPLKHRSD